MHEESRSIICTLTLLALTLGLAGCNANKTVRRPPQAHVAPYNVSSGEVLWAVVPLRNESGTTLVDVHALSDQIVAEAEQVRGVRTVPLNRTIEAMRSLGLVDLLTPTDARKLAAEMGVDGLIVGSVTAWDPYDPPTIGLALALYARPGPMDEQGLRQIDTRELTYQPSDYEYFPSGVYTDRPASVATGVLDGADYQVLMDLDRYANGREDPTGVLGSRRYLSSMDHFSEFAAWRMVGRLVEQEWLRLARVDRVADANR